MFQLLRKYKVDPENPFETASSLKEAMKRRLVKPESYPASLKLPAEPRKCISKPRFEDSKPAIDESGAGKNRQIGKCVEIPKNNHERKKKL